MRTNKCKEAWMHKNECKQIPYNFSLIETQSVALQFSSYCLVCLARKAGLNLLGLGGSNGWMGLNNELDRPSLLQNQKRTVLNFSSISLLLSASLLCSTILLSPKNYFRHWKASVLSAGGEVWFWDFQRTNPFY